MRVTASCETNSYRLCHSNNVARGNNTAQTLLFSQPKLPDYTEPRRPRRTQFAGAARGQGRLAGLDKTARNAWAQCNALSL